MCPARARKPPSSTLVPSSSVLQPTANDHFSVVPCLAAHSDARRHTGDVFLPRTRSRGYLPFLATLALTKLHAVHLRIEASSWIPLCGHRLVPHARLTSRASSWRLINATARLRSSFPIGHEHTPSTSSARAPILFPPLAMLDQASHVQQPPAREDRLRLNALAVSRTLPTIRSRSPPRRPDTPAHDSLALRPAVLASPALAA